MSHENLPTSLVVSPTLPALPASITAAGPAATFAFEEFFRGHLRNAHTRTAYLHAVRRFLDWTERHGVELVHITPGLVGEYLDQHPGSLPTRKLHLAAIRAFCDVLVTRHVLILNPAASVRGERYQVLEGKTPEITPQQVRLLLQSLPTDTVVGLRDRAIIGILVYTAARAGAVAKLKRKHLIHDGTQYTLRFEEKGGKSRAIPVRHDLELILLRYLTAAGLDHGPKETPLFRTTVGRSGRLTETGLTGVDLCRLVKRRLRAAGLPDHLSPHSFRVATVTDLLHQGVSLEDVQQLAGHADPRTTRLYDRRQQAITRNIVERISL